MQGSGLTDCSGTWYLLHLMKGEAGSDGVRPHVPNLPKSAVFFNSCYRGYLPEAYYVKSAPQTAPDRLFFTPYNCPVQPKVGSQRLFCP
jgi:hypothetical protein